MPPPTDPERRERILCEARQLLSDAEGKSWRELAARKEAEQIFAEPLPLEELLQSPMSYPFRLPRSRSADWSSASKDSYLSRWSRENTPTACAERYSRDVRRSYTPVREIADSKVLEESRRPYSSYSKRTPIGFMTLPYRTSINYAEEEQPIRKYDVFQVRSWSYPIYKYLNHREHNYERPYSLTRAYGTTPSYTTPTMTIDAKSRIDGRRGYSGYAYVGLESNFDITSRPRSLTNNNFWRSHYASGTIKLPEDPHGSSPVTTTPVLPCVTSTPIDRPPTTGPPCIPTGNPIIEIDESNSPSLPPRTSPAQPTSRFLRKMRKHYINGQVC